MEEQEIDKSEKSHNQKNYSNIRNEVKNDFERFNFQERKNQEFKKSIDEIVNETQEIATGMNKESDKYIERVRANVYSIANKVGINLYDKEIKKLISKNEKVLSKLEQDKNQYEESLYGNNTTTGLITERKELGSKITQLNSIINKAYMANQDFDKEKDNLEEKIELSIKNDDFDALEILRSEEDKLYFESEQHQDEIENYEDMYFQATKLFKESEKEIDNKKSTIRHLKNNIYNYQKEISIYKKFLGDKSELVNYIQTNKLLEESNNKIKNLLKINQLVEEKSYFVKDRILGETKSISKERENDFVHEEQRQENLKEKQERRNNLSKVNELYSQIMKRR